MLSFRAGTRVIKPMWLHWPRGVPCIHTSSLLWSPEELQSYWTVHTPALCQSANQQGEGTQTCPVSPLIRPMSTSNGCALLTDRMQIFEGKAAYLALKKTPRCCCRSRASCGPTSCVTSVTSGLGLGLALWQIGSVSFLHKQAHTQLVSELLWCDKRLLRWKESAIECCQNSSFVRKVRYQLEWKNCTQMPNMPWSSCCRQASNCIFKKNIPGF